MDQRKDRSSLRGAGPIMGVGVDLEEVTSSKSSISRKVLTQEEMEQLGHVMVRFLGVQICLERKMRDNA